MRESEYIDSEGRKWCVGLPDDAPDSHAPMGVRIGPPSLESLGLPKDIEVRLHNELYNRRLFSLADVERRRQDVLGAIMAIFRLDTQKVIELYR